MCLRLARCSIQRTYAVNARLLQTGSSRSCGDVQLSRHRRPGVARRFPRPRDPVLRKNAVSRCFVVHELDYANTVAVSREYSWFSPRSTDLTRTHTPAANRWRDSDSAPFKDRSRQVSCDGPQPLAGRSRRRRRRAHMGVARACAMSRWFGTDISTHAPFDDLDLFVGNRCSKVHLADSVGKMPQNLGRIERVLQQLLHGDHQCNQLSVSPRRRSCCTSLRAVDQPMMYSSRS